MAPNDSELSYIPYVSLDDYSYELPDDRIATFPLAERDQSKLLRCDARSGAITHHTFSDLPSLLPADALLVVNDTRVVRARVIAWKPTGGRVEIFLLEPVEPSPEPTRALAARGEALWRCMIGGAKKLGQDSAVTARFTIDEKAAGTIEARIEGREEGEYLVRLRWEPRDLTLADVLEAVGQMPLPPYIKRAADSTDAESYQTVYAAHEGAVAAPTAGLHFTPRVLADIAARGIPIERVTLHVGAGTFRQVKGAIAEHEMHQERIAVSAATLRTLLEHARRRETSSGSPLVIVGTTSLRTVESLYWFGARLLLGESVDATELSVEQWDPYRLAALYSNLPTLDESLDAVENWRARNDLDGVAGLTRILILPGYEFRACDALITNFHQPASTLILLVGALLGRDLWRRVYDEALKNGYRFLSYGDSSLLVRGRM